jgi:ParB-like chromosome segregation protein Spo0J
MLQHMILKQIPLDLISFENHAFRISERLDSEPILRSIREIGQLNPLILLDLRPQMAIVCGFRRAHALKQLGQKDAWAQILSTQDCSSSEAFLLALWDNLSHRQLSALEKARALYKLKDICGVTNESIVRMYLPALDLAPNENVLRSYLHINDLHFRLRNLLEEGKLTQSSVEFLAEMPQQTQANIATLMKDIRWSASLQKKALILLDELRALSGNSLDAPLNKPPIQAVLEDAALSPFQKGERVYEILYRLQYPRLSQAESRFHSNREKLEVPGAIQIRPHPFFEEPGLRVEFQASDAVRFRQLAAALHKAAESPDLERLFDLD